MFWWVNIDFHGSSVISKAISTTKSTYIYRKKKSRQVFHALYVFLDVMEENSIGLSTTTTGICYAFFECAPN